MNRRDLVSGFFWLAISVFVCLLSFRAGIGTMSSPGPGFLPFWSAAILGLFAVSLVAKRIKKKNAEKLMTIVSKGTGWKRVILILISLLTYALFLTRMGYLLATFGLLVLLFSILKGSRIWIRLGGALATAVLTYIVFYVCFSVQLPKGILGF